jgi:carboxymethylenebutenolidase
MRTLTVALLALALAGAAVGAAPPDASAGWQHGQFTANGKPVDEYHCAPGAGAPHPALILLHGASPRGAGYAFFEKMCTDLAADGFYTEFIEYYSQTEAVQAGERREMRKDFPVWLAEIRAGIDALDKNPAVDPKRVGMMGYSLGAFLSLSTGATDPGALAAIVEYYGGLPPRLRGQAANLPPTLILHGAADVLVPVQEARDLDALLSKLDRPHQIHIYPGANHAFNFPGLAMWYNATDAEDARQRSIRFLDANLRNAPHAVSARSQ